MLTEKIAPNRRMVETAAHLVLPLPHVDAALAELDHAVNSLGLHGVTLGANVKGRPLDEASFLPLYREINHQQLRCARCGTASRDGGVNDVVYAWRLYPGSAAV